MINKIIQGANTSIQPPKNISARFSSVPTWMKPSSEDVYIKNIEEFSQNKTNLVENKKPLIISSKGNVKGDIKTEESLKIRVNAMLQGNVQSKRFMALSPGAKIIGNASAGEFVALFPGTKIYGDLKFPKDCPKIDIDGEPVNVVWLGTNAKIGNIDFEDGKGLVVLAGNGIKHVNSEPGNPFSSDGGVEKIKITNGEIVQDKEKIDKIYKALKSKVDVLL
ncbi:MAG: polymer-forming cytoskeletal protein [Candidatus Gastranaerophilaceae bacterium]|jgi:hypothetical protein